MESKYSFLEQEAPPGYVAGIGRGATGFTTQADIGGAKLSAFTSTNGGAEGEENEDEDDESRAKFADVDEEKGLLLRPDNKDDDEDDEADKIYEEIEERMKLRRKRKLVVDDGDTMEQLAIQQQETNAISENFKDLKQDLAAVSELEWLNLPEVGDLTKRNKRQRQLAQQEQRFYALPDTILKEELTDFKSISSAKDKLLGLQLDTDGQAQAQAQGNNNHTDASAYLNSLQETNSLIQSSTTNVANIKKARSILGNLRKNEPKKTHAWIASARLEESVKNYEMARNIIQEGCQLNVTSDELWLENVRLAKTTDNKRAICHQALQYQPKSVKLWITLFELTNNDPFTQKRILRKAIENLPLNVQLWELSIELEPELDDKRKLLLKACELTNSIELWLKLIDIAAAEDEHGDLSMAKKYLNDARKANPDSLLIWIHAAKLEEKTSGNEIKVNKMLSKGIKDTARLESRDEYLKLAAQAELEGFPLTCNGIVINFLTLLEETKDRKRWIKDAEHSIEAGLYGMAKSIFQFTLSNFPTSLTTWQNFLKFVKDHYPDEMGIYFEQAIQDNPGNEFLWLWYAKEYLQIGDLQRSTSILKQASDEIPDNEEILFAMIKLQKLQPNSGDTGNCPDKIKEIFEKAISNTTTGGGGGGCTVRVYYKYIHYLRSIDELESALRISDKAIDRFPENWKLYLQKAQIYHEQLNDRIRAQECLEVGIAATLNAGGSGPRPELYLMLYQLQTSTLKKRAILDKAIAQLPTTESALLWREKFRLEKQEGDGDMRQARNILARALKLLPQSPFLWCEYLLNLEKKAQQKTSFKDAMQATQDDPMVLTIIGFILWKEGKINRCKNFFDKSIELNPDLGDSWCYLYAFLKRHGDDEELKELVTKLEKADPHHGEMWCKVMKDIKMENATKIQILDKCIESII